MSKYTRVFAMLAFLSAVSFIADRTLANRGWVPIQYRGGGHTSGPDRGGPGDNVPDDPFKEIDVSQDALDDLLARNVGDEGANDSGRTPVDDGVDEGQTEEGGVEQGPPDDGTEVQDVWVEPWEFSPKQVAFAKSTRIREPIQEAVIAWNGEEEILVLSTRLSANRKGEMLQILPLPSKPSVKKGDLNLFRELERQVTGSKSSGGPGGIELEQKKIGPHDIRIVKVEDEKNFRKWVTAYMNTIAGGEKRAYVPNETQDIIDAYVRDGFHYFVFDILNLDGEEEESRNVPICYRFESDFLYYPLRISGSFGRGDTHVKLMVLSDDPVNYWPRHGLDPDEIKVFNIPGVSSNMVELTPAELGKLNAELGEFFKSPKVNLRRWDIRGTMEGLAAKGDVIGKTRLP